jgi:hypothetical protein
MELSSNLRVLHSDQGDLFVAILLCDPAVLSPRDNVAGDNIGDTAYSRIANRMYRIRCKGIASQSKIDSPKKVAAVMPLFRAAAAANQPLLRLNTPYTPVTKAAIPAGKRGK